MNTTILCEMTACIWNDGRFCTCDEINILDDGDTSPYCQNYDEHGEC